MCGTPIIERDRENKERNHTDYYHCKANPTIQGKGPATDGASFGMIAVQKDVYAPAIGNIKKFIELSEPAEALHSTLIYYFKSYLHYTEGKV